MCGLLMIWLGKILGGAFIREGAFIGVHTVSPKTVPSIYLNTLKNMMTT